MAGDANAFGLYQRAVESNIPTVNAVTKSFYKTNCVLKDMPVETEASLAKRGVRLLGGLPVPNWADINAPAVSWQATPSGYTEAAYQTRDSIDIDWIDMKNKDQIGGAGAVKARRAEWYMEGWGFDYNFRFIQGTHRNDGSGNGRYNPRSIVGLRERLDNPDYQTASDMKINANNLDISYTGQTKSSGGRIIELLKQAIDYVGGGDDGDNCVVYHNDFFIRRLEGVLGFLGTDGGWGFTKDPYGNTIRSFKNAKFRNMGRLAPTTAGAQAGRVISQNEKADGTDGVLGTDTYTSFYVVNWGPGNMTAWQFEPMNMIDIGMLNDGVTYRLVWRYATGLFQESTRCIARVYGINIGYNS
jgi:hypothetical protein